MCRVQTSDFSSVSENDDDDSSDSSGCEWETEEEELVAMGPDSRLVEGNRGFVTYEGHSKGRTFRNRCSWFSVGWMPFQSLNQQDEGSACCAAT